MGRSRGRLQAGLLVTLFFLPGLVLGQEQNGDGTSFGEMCLGQFTAGFPEFVLDTNASVENGATFLASPPVESSRDCVRACCKNPSCNLALVEQSPAGDPDGVQSCFLLNCLYDQALVCRFAKKDGFLNYVRREVYNAYATMRNRGNSGKETRARFSAKGAQPGLEPREAAVFPLSPAVVPSPNWLVWFDLACRVNLPALAASGL